MIILLSNRVAYQWNSITMMAHSQMCIEPTFKHTRECFPFLFVPVRIVSKKFRLGQ